MTNAAMTAEPTNYRRSERTALERRPQRGRYDKPAVHALLDANVLCQIGYVAERQPLMLATIYWRTGDRVFWHGSRQSRALTAMAGAEVCFSVSRLDGLVLGRSAFRHSANYRSVMAFGVARPVEDEAGELAALEAMIERLYPGRWAQVRGPSPAELAATTVLSLELDEVSAKSRSEPPIDLEADLSLPVWAGVAPVKLEPGPLEPCPRLGPDIPAPEGMIDWRCMDASPARRT